MGAHRLTLAHAEATTGTRRSSPDLVGRTGGNATLTSVMRAAVSMHRAFHIERRNVPEYVLLSEELYRAGEAL